jgi:hypothetical protein
MLNDRFGTGAVRAEFTMQLFADIATQQHYKSNSVPTGMNSFQQ